MKKSSVLFLSLVLIFSTVFISSIISEDDPFAGMDMGTEDIAAAAAPSEQAAPQQVSPDNNGTPGDDPFAGMDSGAEGGADILFPDDPAGGTATAPADSGAAADDPFAGMESGNAELPGTGGEAATTNQVPAESKDTIDEMFPNEKPAQQSKQSLSSGPSTNKSVTKTNDIYWKNVYIGGFKKLSDIMDWGLKATSKLSAENDVSMLKDGIVTTAWVEAKKDGGKKQSITFDFAEKYFIGLYEKKYRKVKINKMMILNGFAADKAKWKKHYRVRKMKVTQNNNLKFYIMLRDTMNWQTVTMKNPLIVKPGDVIKAEIMDVYPEVRRNDDTYVAITEFTFLGEPYGPQVELKYVPDSLDLSR